jgi:alanyl-tRNA synthetase
MQGGAMALFGEKYDEQVRVLSIGDFSTELCGGTHVSHVGEIGLFKIVSETGVAAGVRRIEAVTANRALDWIAESENKLEENIGLLKTKNRSLEKEISRLQAKLASQQGSSLVDQAVDVNDIKVLAANLENINAKQLRETLDQLKGKFDKAVCVLASVNGNKISLVAGVTKNITDKIKAGDLVKHVAAQVDGKGGGRADMAQGGGNNPAKLSEALDSVFEWVTRK